MKLAQLPNNIYIIAAFLFIIYGFFKLYDIFRYKKSSINISSIKESVDVLPKGLLFADKNGILLLVNTCMYELSLEILDDIPQDLHSFWKSLESGKLKEGVKRVVFRDNLLIRTNDQKSWTFVKNLIDTDMGEITQISATDTSESAELYDKIKKENIELVEVNKRFKSYAKNINNLVAQEERLNTKIRIHDELGQVLLRTKYYITKDIDCNRIKELFEIWKNSVDILRHEVEIEKKSPLTYLMETARDVGVNITISGDAFQDESVEEMITLLSSEILTNAVKHSKAQNIYIDIKYNMNKYTVIFTNDGIQPTYPITERGGLSNMRKKIERIGGKIKIESTPIFKIIIKIPT
jgi:putative signal transduction histidine kinase